MAALRPDSRISHGRSLFASALSSICSTAVSCRQHASVQWHPYVHRVLRLSESTLEPCAAGTSDAHARELSATEMPVNARKEQNLGRREGRVTFVGAMRCELPIFGRPCRTVTSVLEA